MNIASQFKSPSGQKSLNRAEATALTERIRKHIDAAWADITRAYEGKAWKVLGYETWEAYVRTEFDMSRRRSYQLLDQGRVIQAIGEASGNVNHGTPITERQAREIKPDLPAVTAEIKTKIAEGKEPAAAVKEVVENKRAAKDTAKQAQKAQQAEYDRQRDEAAAALPDAVKQQQAAKDAAIKNRKAPVGLTSDEQIEELQQTVGALEKENAALKAENKIYADMKVQFEQGGFEKVIADKDEQIRVLLSRIESESHEKVANLRRSDYFLKILKDKYNHFADTYIDIETGEVTRE